MRPSSIFIKLMTRAFEPRRAGGGGCLDTLLFRRYLKYWRTCSYILPAHFVKSSDQGHSRSGYQVTLNNLTSETVWMLGIATPTYRSLWNFQLLISVTISSWRQWRPEKDGSELVSDNGTPFTSQSLRCFCRVTVKHIKTSPYHPAGSGAVQWSGHLHFWPVSTWLFKVKL